MSTSAMNWPRIQTMKRGSERRSHVPWRRRRGAKPVSGLNPTTSMRRIGVVVVILSLLQIQIFFGALVHSIDSRISDAVSAAQSSGRAQNPQIHASSVAAEVIGDENVNGPAKLTKMAAPVVGSHGSGEGTHKISL